MDFLPDEKVLCHRTNFTLSCRDLVVGGKCRRWKQLLGEHPQTAEVISGWDCIDNHMVMLMLNFGRSQDQTTKSIDKMHNAAVERHDETVAVQKSLSTAIAISSMMLEAPRDQPKLIENGGDQ